MRKYSGIIHMCPVDPPPTTLGDDKEIDENSNEEK